MPNQTSLWMNGPKKTGVYCVIVYSKFNLNQLGIGGESLYETRYIVDVSKCGEKYTIWPLKSLIEVFSNTFSIEDSLTKNSIFSSVEAFRNSHKNHVRDDWFYLGSFETGFDGLPKRSGTYVTA